MILHEVLIRRRVMGNVKLSNGLYLKEGTRTWMDTAHMKDPAIVRSPYISVPTSSPTGDFANLHPRSMKTRSSGTQNDSLNSARNRAELAQRS